MSKWREEFPNLHKYVCDHCDSKFNCKFRESFERAYVAVLDTLYDTATISKDIKNILTLNVDCENKIIAKGRH